jgi:glycosyltransferase involved in cell wall biosynthesis
LENTVQFAGPKSGIELQKAYDEADLFVLPSHTENFGMVVGEALVNGIPVITTQGTPWRDLLMKRCGWWIPISAEGIAGALIEATKMSDSSLEEMGQRGRRWIASDFSWDRTATKMMRLYERAVGNRACVVTNS